MIPRDQSQRRGCAAYVLSVHRYISSVRGRLNRNCRTLTNNDRRHRCWILCRRYCRGIVRWGSTSCCRGCQCFVYGLGRKLDWVEGNVSIDVSGDFSPLRDRNVFAVHEQKQWSSREENDAGSNDRTCHRSNMTTAFNILDGTKCDLFTRRKAHFIDIHVELAPTAHSPFRLSLGYSRPGNSTSRDHQQIPNFDIL